ncbi:hypothetical protein Sjap_018901 [Stephania japonica]|uniref:Uncharacterized protein n=1 Tax=Stephania japonica TaxID=461633 RepID=A0AAP0I8S4_9MAGN
MDKSPYSLHCQYFTPLELSYLQVYRCWLCFDMMWNGCFYGSFLPKKLPLSLSEDCLNDAAKGVKGLSSKISDCKHVMCLRQGCMTKIEIGDDVVASIEATESTTPPCQTFNFRHILMPNSDLHRTPLLFLAFQLVETFCCC